MLAPTMPQSLVGMNPAQAPSPLQPIPNARPMAPTPMPGGMPPPPGLPQMAQPGNKPPAMIGVDQGNGTIALHFTNPNGSIGPVWKVMPSPKGPGSGAPQGQAPAPAVSMQGGGVGTQQ